MRNNLPVIDEEFLFPAGQTLVSTTDIKGNIVYYNPAFIEVSGYSKQELCGGGHLSPAMQIEEGFRDVKSLRFGFALDLHRTRCPRRIEVLLLIAALGGYVLHLAGLHARDSGEARRYQSNTVRTKAVLSVWRVGLEYLRRHAGALPRHVLVATERLLCDEVHRQAQGLG